ncbi:hypothetical protein U1Q18_011783 [Sarracenia purpurea var. burkii]
MAPKLPFSYVPVQEMSFMKSKNQPSSFAQSQEVKLSDGRDKGGEEATNSVTSCLYLKSSSQPLDKNVVLRRIRHHKNLNKIRSTFQGLLGGPSPSEKAGTVAAHQQKSLDDAFFSP